MYKDKPVNLQGFVEDLDLITLHKVRAVLELAKAERITLPALANLLKDLDDKLIDSWIDERLKKVEDLPW